MEDNRHDCLLDEFPPVSARQWKLKIQADLKGAPYETLITPTPEGIDIRPFYHLDEYHTLPSVERPSQYEIVSWNPPLAGPGEIPALQARQVVWIDRPWTPAIQAAPWEPFAGVVRWHASLQHAESAAGLLRAGHTVYFSPLSRLTATGQPDSAGGNDREALQQIWKTHPQARLTVDAALFADAGANLVQQTAYALAQYLEYAEWLGPEAAGRIRVDMAVGSRYFHEIAKLRALRYLWKEITGGSPQIFVRPTLRNKTLADPYNNMLRTGMEMMAAVLGGADQIANLPYDYLFARRAESYRLADNQLVLLREEASFESRRIAADGSYFLDEWTWRLADKAMTLLDQIRAGGGYLAQLRQGTIQRHVSRAARREQERFDRGEITLIGVNKYVLEDEQLPAPLPGAFRRRRKRRTLIRPVVPVRLAETVERERLKQQGIEI